ncbi:MAG: hypothetical protein IKT14_02175, partial [Clostridiales bacterium]|nr:hypothetical protein [Clostridiales bacterium]
GLKYTFVVNGQTGEPAGDLPYSPVKRVALVALEIAKWVGLGLAFTLLFIFVFVKALFIDVSGATVMLYYLSIFLSGFLGAGFSLIIRRIRKVKYDSMNPIDSAPEVENYLDLSEKIHMEKHDKFGYMKTTREADEDDNRNGLVKYMMKRSLRIR